MKPIHVIRLPTTCGYQKCGESTGFNVRSIFAQYYFVLPVLHNILNNCFVWTFHYLNCLTILEGDIISIANYEYYKYFSIAAWGISGGSCDAK